MVALVASHVARCYDLDALALVEMALVHDLVEAYAGDTPTLFPLTPEGLMDKKEREAAALQRLRVELDGFPHLLDRIQEFEDGRSVEAKYVHAIDKLVPRLTGFLNHGSAIIDQGAYKILRDRISGQDAELPDELAPPFVLDFIEAGEDLLRRIESPPAHMTTLCPLCGWPVEWSIPGLEEGARGSALCLRSNGVRRDPRIPLMGDGSCSWEGTVRRVGSGVVVEQ
jgi:hypothetical protein